MSLLDEFNSSKEFSNAPVSLSARSGFRPLFLVWINFQLSTVMLFFGGITLAHLSFPDALLVTVTATLIIAAVSYVIGYLGAKEGLSTALLCERLFGSHGGIVQQIFQGLIELGWFIVIVSLTGDAAATLLHVSDNSLIHGLVTLIMGALYVLSICYGFKGLEIISTIAAPIVLILLAILAIIHFLHTSGPLWHPISGGPNILQSISIATGTFITGAALSSDISRFAKTPSIGAITGALGFLVTIPLQLLLGAMVAMTSTGSPDFLRAISEFNLGPLVFIFLIVANCIGDATLYLAVVPLAKLLRLSSLSLVLILGTLGSCLAALGISNLIVWWLNLLSILLPPLAGPMIWATLNAIRGKKLPDTTSRVRPGFIAWLIGSVAGGATNLIGIGLAPVIGILISFLICMLTTTHDRQSH